MEPPAIRHTSSADGTRLAYWSYGRGPALLYIGVPCCSHVQLEFKLPPLKLWYDQLSKHFRLVRLDLRGYGASQRDGMELSVERFGEDILAVADALGIEEFSLFVQGGASPAALALAARSSRVERLIVFDGWADGINLPAHGSMSAALGLARARYHEFAGFVARVVLGASGNVAPEIERLLLQAATFEQWERLSELFLATDVSTLLSSVVCPSLVIHSGSRLLTGQGEESLAMSRAIPNARLATFEIRSFPLGDTTQVLQEILEFIPRGEDEPDFGSLSTREAEVLALIREGRTNQQIAERLVISPQTVARHVHNLLTKLGFANRTEAAAWAARQSRER